VHKRPDWEDYFLVIARAVARRGDCTRRQVGAILIDPETHDIIQTGYNGAPPNEPGCLTAGACPRGQHYELPGQLRGQLEDSVCACGNPWPCPQYVESYAPYDAGLGMCIAIHAEENILLRAGKLARGTYMYVTHCPCHVCIRLLTGAGVAKVIWPGHEIKLENSFGAALP
jgi:dCMP deaminase